MTDRATSTMLSYALTLSIITLLVSGVFVAAGGYVEDQQERSIRAELDVIGNRLASDFASVDRLAQSDEESTVKLSIDLPDRVAGTSYRIETGELEEDLYAINLTTTDPSVDVRVTVKLATELEATDVSGGDVAVTYGGDRLEVERA